MRIAPRNLYAILCYAWDVLDRKDHVPVGLNEETVPTELLARVLAREVDRLLKRGLARAYVEESDDLRNPRGRLDLGETVARALLPQRRLRCTYEEQTPATVLNGLLRAALIHAVGLPHTTDTAHALRAALRHFPLVPAVTPTARAFAAVRLHRHTAPYRFALHAAELLVTGCVPVSGGDRRAFDDFTRDEAQMGRLFQRFVYRFLATEQSRWAVSAPTLSFVAEGDKASIGRVPRMETDLTLRGRLNGLGDWILELKSVAETVQGRHGTERLRSDHLYQILTYLQTRERHGIPARGGVLLYAESHAGPLRHDLRLNGHVMKVRSVPLHGDWSAVRSSLLGLGEELALDA